jgi:hypothetical protein
MPLSEVAVHLVGGDREEVTPFPRHAVLAEAQRIAAETLRGMDPEIAAARSLKEKAEKKPEEEAGSVPEACDMWIADHGEVR